MQEKEPKNRVNAQSSSDPVTFIPGELLPLPAASKPSAGIQIPALHPVLKDSYSLLLHKFLLEACTEVEERG